MGNQASSSKYSSNDYELAIKCSKTLEHRLAVDLGAQGAGLHEKVSHVESQLDRPLVKDLRYLATMRNKLIHEIDFHRLPDRSAFISVYERCHGRLAAHHTATTSSSRSRGCVIS